jgi:hypothetical protein
MRVLYEGRTYEIVQVDFSAIANCGLKIWNPDLIASPQA